MGMVVGLCEITMRLRQAQSLKDKRRALRQVIERTRARFDLSISETDANDDLRQARVGFAYVSNDSRVVESTLDRVLHFIRELHAAEIVHTEREIVHWEGPWGEMPLTMADLDDPTLPESEREG